MFPHVARNENELSVAAGETVNVLSHEGEWSLVELNGRQGYLPSTYLQPL